MPLATRMSVVSEIMPSRKAISLRLDRTPSVLEAVNLMIANKVGSVVVLDADGSPRGIITERDVLKKVTKAGKSPSEIAVQDIMSHPVVTVKPFDSIDTAAAIMTKNKIKRLVVLEQDGTFRGVLSITDITRMLSKILTDDYQRFGHLKAMIDLVDL